MVQMLQTYDLVQSLAAYIEKNIYAQGLFFMEKTSKEDKKKIVLPDKLQEDMLNFFMKTSIPRIAKEKRKNKALSEKEGQEIKC